MQLRSIANTERGHYRFPSRSPGVVYETVINERIEVLGAVPEPRFVQELQRALAPKET
jgi:hypothetical protein